MPRRSYLLLGRIALATAVSLVLPPAAAAQVSLSGLSGYDPISAPNTFDGAGGAMLDESLANAYSTMVIGDVDAANGSLGTRLLNSRYATNDPLYDGVVRIFMKDQNGAALGSCSGSLMNNTSILTAAHCVAFTSGPTIGTQRAYQADIVFRRYDGTQVTLTNAAELISIAPGYTGSVVDRRDLAVIRLNTMPPEWARSYTLFDGNPFDQEAIFAGYGRIGDGTTGDAFSGISNQPPNLRLQGTNRWEVSREGNTLYSSVLPSRGILVYDFDNGALNRNSICTIFYGGAPTSEQLQSPLCQSGYGLNEVALGRGDSGGPGFIMQNGQLRIAGVASWVSSGVTTTGAACPQVSCFGAIGGHTDATFDMNRAWIESMVVPEPGTYVLVVTGLVCLVGVGARRRRQMLS